MLLSPVFVCDFIRFQILVLVGSLLIKSELLCWIAFALWNIWKFRCEIVYENVDPNPLGIIFRIGATVGEYLKSKPMKISSAATDGCSCSH